MILTNYIAAAATTSFPWETVLYAIALVMFLWLLYRQEQKHTQVKKELTVRIERSNSQLENAIRSNRQGNIMMSSELMKISKSFHTFIESEKESLIAIDMRERALQSETILATYSRIWNKL
jgi:hypothetical protein